ncbi:GNAT family N-acetyltransferase [Paenibacillus sp. MABNR03]|uniref:GNAT family N-acetyltransferase n=1 Tax=Paenibacillus sp. MABNR03 TaxID=3142626 RepID=UPI003D2C5FBB
MNTHIRRLNENDPVIISHAFQEQGWEKPVEQYLRYLVEQHKGERVTLVAELDGAFAGYVNVLWNSHYPSFREQGIPEINDFNVLIKYQRQGIGSRLMDRAEELIRERTDTSRDWGRCILRLWQSSDPIRPPRIYPGWQGNS